MSKGEQTRQSILNRAMGLASLVGLEGLTIGRLADDLKLSKSGLFAHFQSKEALQTQVLDRAAAEFTRAVIHPVLAAPAGEHRLNALHDRWVAWGKSSPGGCIFVAAAVELDDRPGPVRDHLVELQKSWITTVEQIAQSAIDVGYFRPGIDIARFAQDTYGIMLSHYLYGRLFRDRAAESRARAAYDELLAGLRPATPSRSKARKKKD